MKILALLALSAAFAASARELTGGWIAQIPESGGMEETIFVFKQQGDALTGSVFGRSNGGNIAAAKVDGNQVTFEVIRKPGTNEDRVVFTGRISNNEIRFTRTSADGAKVDFLARYSGPLKEGGSVVGGLPSGRIPTGGPPSPPPPPAKKSEERPSLTVQRIRVGGAVQAKMLVTKEEPEYPPVARKARVQGVVRLRATIAGDGTVQNLEMVSGHPLLVPAAVKAVKTWVYRPTLLNGVAVEVITQIDVPFILDK